MPDFRDGPTPGASHPTDKWDDDPTETAPPSGQDRITTTAATTPATPHMTPEHRLRYDLLRALDRYKATADYLPLVEVARAVEGGAYDHA